jgi:hypothetical protein
MKTVFVQNWLESERGYGQRPDGYTVHSDRDQCCAYIARFVKRNHTSDRVPDVYTTFDGDPIEIEVDDALHSRILAATSACGPSGDKFLAVWGNGQLFSTSPMRALRHTDIAWPVGY